MELITVNALVIRESEYGENDKLLTVLSAELGAVGVIFKGGKSLKNKNSASAQLLNYSEFVLKKRGSLYILNEASLIEQFFSLRSSLDRFSLGQYVCELCSHVGTENEDSSALLSLALNTLYMLCKSEKSTEHIKAVFEIRLACICGFTPDVFSCSSCGKEGNYLYLDVMNGICLCPDCFGQTGNENAAGDLGTANVILPLRDEVLMGMRYVIGASPKRIFSFSLSQESEDELCRVSEKYLLNHIERGFKTLDFYKNVKKLGL